MGKAHAVTFPRRGEVWLVRFDPAEGGEIRKTRPALILQNDIGNRHSPATIVVAIASKQSPRLYPTEVSLDPPEGGLEKASVVKCDQIRTLDKGRLLRRLGAIPPAAMERVERTIKISLGLIDL